MPDPLCPYRREYGHTGNFNRVPEISGGAVGFRRASLTAGTPAPVNRQMVAARFRRIWKGAIDLTIGATGLETALDARKASAGGQRRSLPDVMMFTQPPTS